ncbi:hypothetical protein ANTPLA_LOCUS5514 [Anthophora plagiata]
MNEAGRPSKQASNLAARLACKQDEKSFGERTEGRREGIDRTTRTVRKYIPQHGSIRRRRRYIDLDQTGWRERGEGENVSRRPWLAAPPLRRCRNVVPMLMVYVCGTITTMGYRTAAIAGEMPNGLQDCAGLAVRSLARSGMADGR